MPNPNTNYTVGVVVTSTAVPVVNQTGEALFGRPFIVRRETVNTIFQQTTVTDSAGSHIVTVTNYTHTRPDA